MAYPTTDEWYFGDYLGRLPGKHYSILVNFIIILLFAQIALTTEPNFQTKSGSLALTFSLNLIELFFISDYIGKIANSWAKLDYCLSRIWSILFSKFALIDFALVFLLLTDYFNNDSFVVIGTYVFKAFLSMYFSSFQRVLKRVAFIISDSPAYTFFPLILLSLVTYVMAFCIYLLEKSNDLEHFGSIVRSLWFSIVTMTTIGYGDVTPSTSLGKLLAIVFGLVGIICVALLTANILEANSKFNELESSAKL